MNRTTLRVVRVRGEHGHLAGRSFEREFSFQHDEFDEFGNEDDRFQVQEIYVNGDDRLMVHDHMLWWETGYSQWRVVDADFEIVPRPLSAQDIAFVVAFRRLADMETDSFWRMQDRLDVPFLDREVAVAQCLALSPKQDLSEDLLRKVFRMMF